MTYGKFSEIAEEIVIPVIGKVSKLMPRYEAIAKEMIGSVHHLKKSIYEDYMARRDSFKQKQMSEGLNAKINRHKIAVMFYISFIMSLEKNGFFKSKEKTRYLFAHNTMLNAAIAIIEAFIDFDEGRRDHSKAYRSYVKKFGLIRNAESSRINIKKYIASHKKNAMDELDMAIDFHVVECDSKAEFKNAKGQKSLPVKKLNDLVRKES